MTPARGLGTLAVGLVVALAGAQGLAQDFTYNPPGALFPGSGDGRVDYRVYVPGARFPIEVAPAYPNSQVWGNGGMNGPGGSQCDAVNYSYPWWDNYCETRSWDMPLCPSGVGHQGQDIRPSTCVDDTHWAVAAEAGTITYIGSYSVNLTTDAGVLHRYLHMAPSSLVVEVGDEVLRGDRLGRVSDAFGDSSTTIHLHYDIFMDIEEVGPVYVPPYLTLVEGYETLIGQEGTMPGSAGLDGLIIDDGDPNFVLHGPAATWRYVTTAGYDGDLHWSYSWENAASNWAEWLFTVGYAGTWQIEVYITPAYAQAENLRYTVRHEGGEQEVRRDVSSADGWVALGTFDFEVGGNYNVAVYDGPGDALSLQHQFVADAVRITPIDVEVPGDEGPDAPPDAGGPDQDAGDDPSDTADTGPDPEPDLPEPDTAPDAPPDAGNDPGLPDAEADPGVPAQPVEVTVNSGCGCAASAPPSRGSGGPAGLVLTCLAGLLLVRSRRGSRRSHKVTRS